MIALDGASARARAFAKDAHAAQLVHCYGVNGCKGEGFKGLTAKKCAAAGGSLQAKRPPKSPSSGRCGCSLRAPMPPPSSPPGPPTG